MHAFRKRAGFQRVLAGRGWFCATDLAHHNNNPWRNLRRMANVRDRRRPARPAQCLMRTGVGMRRLGSYLSNKPNGQSFWHMSAGWRASLRRGQHLSRPCAHLSCKCRSPFSHGCLLVSLCCASGLPRAISNLLDRWLSAQCLLRTRCDASSLVYRGCPLRKLNLRSKCRD